MLHFNEFGHAQGRPLVIAHGLFGSARNWGVISRRLADSRRIITVDMRNHGQSPWSDTNSYADMAGDLAEVIAAQGGQADLLGHSMGGKAAMFLALTQPALVNRLLVADISPVPYRHTQAHLIRAIRTVDLDAVSKRSDADRQLRRWIVDDGVRAFLLQSLDLHGDRPRWVLNLDVLERDMAAIVGFPEVGGQFDGPALFVTGGASDYVPAAHHEDIRRRFPGAVFHEIAGAGHWLHAEKPREFEVVLRGFLEG